MVCAERARLVAKGNVYDIQLSSLFYVASCVNRESLYLGTRVASCVLINIRIIAGVAVNECVSDKF